MHAGAQPLHVHFMLISHERSYFVNMSVTKLAGWIAFPVPSFFQDSLQVCPLWYFLFTVTDRSQRLTMMIYDDL